MRARRSRAVDEDITGHRLQRGRALARAEMSEAGNEQAHHRTLQRGRALARAEIRVRRAGSTDRGASTGPRTCARGDFCAAVAVPDGVTLQRGRALARAEMTPGTQDDRPRPRFNGAAHLRARRFRRVHVVVERRDRASTGPRTCARGDLAQVSQRMGPRGASTGPRTCARGDSYSEADIRDWFYASTGPRTCARGDSCSAISRRVAHVASTGPRTCARGDFLYANVLTAHKVASTGPRTCARGDADRSDCSQGFRGFNGAAHLRARR